MKKSILLSLIINFIVLLAGMILMILSVFLKNQIVLICGLVLLVISSMIYFVFAIILFRIFLLKKGG